jgi:hypothetical protein
MQSKEEEERRRRRRVEGEVPHDEGERRGGVASFERNQTNNGVLYVRTYRD